MAHQDVHTAIGEISERVLHRATENLDLCQRFMALVSLLALECNERGANMSGLQMGNVVMSGNRLIAKVTFSKLIVSRSPEAAPSATGLIDFMHKEAKGLWLFVNKNPCLVTYLQQMVEKMDTYCRDKSKEFNEVEFAQAFMDKEDNVVLEIGA